MPDWQPNWSDVEFDHGAASTAAVECRAAARALTTALDGLAGLPATDHWTGRYKDEWSADQGGMQSDLAGTRDDLNALASRIDGAAVDARAEQTARDDGRERWLREAAEEADRRPVPTGPRVPE